MAIGDGTDSTAPATPPPQDVGTGGGMRLSIGSSFERYTIEALIGEGGMGQVYRALDSRLHRKVALKVLRIGPGEDAATWGESVSRMMREARAAAALDHPNVVAVFDLGESEGIPYIAMEHVVGSSLRHYVGQTEVPVAQRLQWLADVARALGAAHDAGIVHRDVKPENVLVRKDGVVKVLDFGIARRARFEVDGTAETATGNAAFATLTAKGTVVGTLYYMAPEQLHGESVDSRADQFSWGVMAYELLSGSLPWEKKDPMAVIAAILAHPPRPLGAVCPELPAEVATVIDRALSKNAVDRFPSMAALVEALQSHVSVPLSPEVRTGDTPAPVHQLSTRGALVVSQEAPPVKPVRRRRWKIALIAGFGIAVVCSVFVGRRLTRTAALAAADASLACPALRVSGVEEPSGWLGAAAATIACERAAILLGGRVERTMVPAELLDLPQGPSESFPRDPYAEPSSRDRAVAAARAQATAWLDGDVVRERDRFRVTLILRRADGEEVGRGTGHQVALHEAVRDAMAPLITSGALPVAAALDASLAPWTSSGEVATELALNDLWVGLRTLASIDAQCAQLATSRDKLGAAWADVAAECGDHNPPAPPPIDRSSATAFARTAAWRVVRGQQADRKALADETRSWREKESSPAGKKVLALLEAQLLFEAGDIMRARELALGAVQNAPRDRDLWFIVQGSSYRMTGFGHGARANAAWEPQEPDTWNMISYGDQLDSLAQRIAFLRRGVLVSNDHPLYATNLAGLLLDDGKREEARAMSARMMVAGPSRVVGAGQIQGQIEASQGHFNVALQQWMQILMGLDEIGVLDRGDIALVRNVLDVAAILGRNEAVAGQIWKRYIQPDPPRLSAHGRFSAELGVQICMRTDKDTVRGCLLRVEKLLSGDYFQSGVVAGGRQLIEAVRMSLDGDAKGVMQAIHPLDAGMATRGGHVAEIFDAVGAHAEAQRVDDTMISIAPRFHGASLATLRSARRADKRGDRDAARKLAQQIIDAWGDADADVPAVAEMRVMLKRLGH